MRKIENISLKQIAIYLVLIIHAGIILLPISYMLITSFKDNMGIFRHPFGLPKSLNFQNYIELINRSNFGLYILNSIIVTVSSIFSMLLFGSAAAFIFAKYKFWAKTILFGFFLAGITIPIRLGTVNIFQMMMKLALMDTRMALIVVFTAMSIPVAVFILTDFIKQIPQELFESARMDGCNEPRIFAQIVLPLIRPALAAVALYNFVPIWNNFWFPLILTRSENVYTLPLAVANLFGQYETSYGLVFAALSLASLPAITFYLILSRQFLKNIGTGAGIIKG